MTDTLTQTYNRSKLDALLKHELERSIRYKHPFSLIMIDIDFFKMVNDIHGHLEGDKVLIQFASILQKNIRSNDYLGRWGGEEFLIICSNTSLDEALVVAEKLRTCVGTSTFDKVNTITASFGITSWKEDDSHEIIIKRVDDALYHSKKSGRNCVSKIV